MVEHIRYSKGMRHTLVYMAFAGLSACNAIPSYSIHSSVALPTTFDTQAHASATNDVDTQWWYAFKDPQLEQLINRAAAANFDVRTAVERVNEARAGAAGINAALLPTLNLTGSVGDNRTGLPDYVKNLGNPDTQFRRIALEPSWNMDLFGGIRAAKNAALRDQEAAVWGVAGARLNAISETARQYFIYQSLLERRRLHQELFATEQQSLTLAQHLSREGMYSDIDLNRIQADLLNIQSSLPGLNAALISTQNQIALLTATPPQQMQLQPNAAVLISKPLIDPIPTGMPADLLTRRPDIQAAEKQVAAENARLGQAKANRFPQLFLSTVFGDQALTLNHLALAPSFYTNTALAFTAPIFDGGRIKAEINNQQAKRSEAVINYDKTVLTALNQVENALAARHGEQDQLVMLEGIQQQRQQSEQHAQALVGEGQISRLQLLDIQRARLSANMALVDNQQQNALYTIDVYSALGGGWQSFQSEASQPNTTTSHQTLSSQSTSR